MLLPAQTRMHGHGRWLTAVKLPTPSPSNDGTWPALQDGYVEGQSQATSPAAASWCRPLFGSPWPGKARLACEHQAHRKVVEDEAEGHGVQHDAEPNDQLQRYQAGQREEMLKPANAM